MIEPTVEEVVSLVSSTFEIKAMAKSLDIIQFKIDDKHFKKKFVELVQKLESRDLVCKLETLPDGLYILVRRLPPRKQRKWLSTAWTSRLLFAIVVGFVMVDGYYRTLKANEIIDIGNPLEMAGIYTLSLLGILGVHELGHLVASKLHKLKTSWPYFIPGIPAIPDIQATGFFTIPTFGAVIKSRSSTINREILFDVAIAGPIAGLIITILVTVYGAYTAPIIPEDLVQQLHEQSILFKWNFGEPLLMTAALTAFGKGGDGQWILQTPVLFAAWLGFLITFLNLLPAWQLDGGHMARTLLGEKWHKYATFASMGVLVLLGYWFMAMFILLLSSRNPGVQPLDDISPLPRNRKITYIAVVILAILCAPLPFSVLS